MIILLCNYAIIIINYTKQVMHNVIAHHSLTSQFPNSISFPANSPQFHWPAWCHMVWDIPLGQLSWLSPPNSLCTSSSSLRGSTRSWTVLGSAQHRLATSKTSVWYQHCLSPKSKTVSYTRLCEKTLFQPKPGHFSIRKFRKNHSLIPIYFISEAILCVVVHGKRRADTKTVTVLQMQGWLPCNF